MGYWSQNESGHSFATAQDEDMVWGDAPADIMDTAVDRVVKVFEQDMGRKPTKAEIFAGLKFATNLFDDKMEKKEL